MFATSSTLLSYSNLHAGDNSQWECTPSPDFRSWNCLRDGKSPVETIPESAAPAATPSDSSSAVTTTPLAQPEPVQPSALQIEADTQPTATQISEPTPPSAEPSQPLVAPPLPARDEPPAAPEPAEEPATIKPSPDTVIETSQDEARQLSTTEVVAEETAGPVVAEPEPAQPVISEQAPDAPMTTEDVGTPQADMATSQVMEKPVEPQPTSVPEPQPTSAPEPESSAPVAQEQAPAQPEARTASEQPTAAYTAPLTDKYAPLESSLVSVDESLRSCVAINRPMDTRGEDLNQLRERSPTEIEADEAQIEQDKTTVLSGDVTITRADQSLKSDKVILDKVTSQADASGQVFYTDNQVQIKAEQAHLDFIKDEHSFAEAGFITLDRYSRGTAGQIQVQQKDKIKLDKVNYTTCPPGNTAWQLEADEIVLDDTTGRGEATNVKLEFHDVPVMYLPYMSFPIDDRRKTGLLTPRVGNSDKRGTEITAPYYWNIAPDMDATFYPRYMSKRGLQLGGEYRYLMGDTNSGQINAEYLADDDEYLGKGDNDRWGFRYDHRGYLPGDQWYLNTQFRRVSDDRYFEDLGSSPSLSSTTHLNSFMQLSRGSNNWSAYGLVQNYQTVDRTIAEIDRPYKRLPHLSFNYWTDPFAERFTADIKTSYTQFDHTSNLKVTGDRTAIYPSITYNYDTGGYYIRPKLGVHYTHYSLDNQGTLPSSPDRSIPIFSIDSGLFYEKDTTLFGKSMLQTLEPRFYYLHADEENQNNIPIFDTSLLDFNSSSLFSENRFSGIDRIGDANQLSVGVTTRLLDAADGTEKVSATLGQIYYFSDRDVTLPGEAPDTDDVSPIIAELNYRPYRELVASAQLHWDPEESKTERQLYRVKYQPEDDKILNVAYRYRDKLLKQTDVSALWPLDKNKRWHAIGRWNYSIKDSKTLDTFGGIEYESCCWKTRVVARRWVTDVDSDYDTGIFFELELKGLGSFGDDITSFLETGILGYDRHIKENDDDTYYY